MAVQTLTLPTSFEQDEIAKEFDRFANAARDEGDEMREWTLRQHAANARNTARYLRGSLHRCDEFDRTVTS